MSAEARTLTPEQFERINVSMAQARESEEAHRRAARKAATFVEAIQQHIQERNYGAAEQACGWTLGKLPYDHGAQEFYPLYDEALEQMRR